MPQLIPFYFINQVLFIYILLLIVIYMFSKFILPLSILKFSIRHYINQL